MKKSYSYILIGVLIFLFVLPAGHALKFKVVDQHEDPIGGVDVKVYTDYYGEMKNRGSCTTYESGRCSSSWTISREGMNYEAKTFFKGSIQTTVLGTLDDYDSEEGVLLTLSLHSLTVTAADRKAHPLDGATVEISRGDYKTTLKTDKDGKAVFEQLPEGDYEIKASYGSSTTTKDLEISGDSKTQVSLTAHDITVEVLKETGAPVSGVRVELSGPDKFSSVKETGTNGKAVFEQLPEGDYTIKASYDEKTKKQEKEITGDLTVKIALDFSAPEISSVSHTPSNPLDTSIVTITARIIDAGEYASGIKRVDLDYTAFGKSKSVPMSTMDDIMYSVQIPAYSVNTSVTYIITAEDNENNIQTTTPRAYKVVSQVLPVKSEGSGILKILGILFLLGILVIAFLIYSKRG